MKINELKNKLVRKKIPRDLYCLDKEYPNEAYCVHFNGCEWEVYYSEKGQKTNIRTYLKEEKACLYFYDLIINDLTEMGLI